MELRGTVFSYSAKTGNVLCSTGEVSDARVVPEKAMNRTLCVLACCLCWPLLSGCIICPYPTVGYTPSVNTSAPSDEIHAFRVDFTNHYGWFFSDTKENRGKLDSRQKLSLLSVGHNSEIASQVKPAINYGVILLVADIPGTGVLHTSESIGLRLYRPGFELVEINSWELANKVEWRRVDGLAGQERVLDQLFPTDGNTFGDEAYVFGASEYMRLSNEAISNDDRTRLEAKARAAMSR